MPYNPAANDTAPAPQAGTTFAPARQAAGLPAQVPEDVAQARAQARTMSLDELHTSVRSLARILRDARQDLRAGQARPDEVRALANEFREHSSERTARVRTIRVYERLARTRREVAADWRRRANSARDPGSAMRLRNFAVREENNVDRYERLARDVASGAIRPQIRPRTVDEATAR